MDIPIHLLIQRIRQHRAKGGGPGLYNEEQVFALLDELDRQNEPYIDENDVVWNSICGRIHADLTNSLTRANDKKDGETMNIPMDLRDQFALAATEADISHHMAAHVYGWDREAARYSFADAMMQSRKTKEEREAERLARAADDGGIPF